MVRYPEFRLVEERLAALYFADAGDYCANDACNPVNQVEGQLERLLGLLTAHIAWLNAPRDAQGNPSSDGSQPASSLVGRISSASEGSVSVSVENSAEPGTAQWYMQTRYGADYWARTAAYRTARYVANPTLLGDRFLSARRNALLQGWRR